MDKDMRPTEVKDVFLNGLKREDLSFVRVDGKSLAAESLAPGERSDDYYRVHFYVHNSDLAARGIDIRNSPKGPDGDTRVSIRVWAWQVKVGSDMVDGKRVLNENKRNVRLLSGDRTYNVGIPQYNADKTPVLNEAGKMVYAQVRLTAAEIKAMTEAARHDFAAAEKTGEAPAEA